MVGVSLGGKAGQGIRGWMDFEDRGRRLKRDLEGKERRAKLYNGSSVKFILF